MAKEKTLLDQPRDLLSWYLHFCGLEEIPQEYHYWGFLSLIGALAGDRLRITRIIGQPLYLNLYVMLVGPSGSGKSLAFTRVFQLAKKNPDATNSHSGRITAEAIYDLLKKNPRLFLGIPELSEGVRSGDLAVRFIKTLTDLYSGGARIIDERTRTGGTTNSIISPCVSFLGATTVTWLYDSIPSDEMTSGFLGRFAPVFVESKAPRLFQPKYPKDQEETRIKLELGLQKIAKAKGEIQRTTSAMELAEEWYMNRPEPLDPGLASAHARERELLFKLAGIACLCEYGAQDDAELIIKKGHISFARETVEQLQQSHLRLLQLGDPNNNTTKVTKTIEDYIRTYGPVKRANIVRIGMKAGILADTVDRIIHSLLQIKRIQVLHPPGKGLLYEWSTVGYTEEDTKV